MQYQSSFFHVSIQKFYTWLIFFTQPAVVMVVTNMKFAKILIILNRLHKIALNNNLLASLEDQPDVADGGGEGGSRHLPDQPLHVVTHL